ncbi:MAG TPA: type II toxin-antitoxin system Phd/YefM family antitoxin [Chloroflexota bacterium]|nr:type II toxin-antitoxin system Phd/YefM family antitoxin [Chloroflexota bacterium]
MEVGIRELKAHLSEYIDKACKGETVVVTERGKPKVGLVPVRDDWDTLPERYRQLVLSGAVRDPGGPAGRRPLPPPLESPSPAEITSTDLIRWARGHDVPAIEEALRRQKG